MGVVSCKQAIARFKPVAGDAPDVDNASGGVANGVGAGLGAFVGLGGALGAEDVVADVVLGAGSTPQYKRPTTTPNVNAKAIGRSEQQGLLQPVGSSST